jgi:SAM-dependent methyltransferase
MRLSALEHVWDRLGRDDPYWAAVTWEGKEHGRWSAEDFFATGAHEIGVIFKAVAEHGWTVGRRRALDFGCGPGRLTQALAEHFESVDGVDIAASMIALARRHNRHPERCRYHHNTAADLRLFESGTFDFVYSSLVLQHMPPEDAKGYVREMMRVATRGGLVVFQIPSHRGDSELPPGARQTLALAPLPGGAFQAEIVPAESTLDVRAGSTLALALRVTNRGSSLWPSLSGPDRRFAVQVGNRWLSPGGIVQKEDDGRVPLPYDVAAGQEVRVVLEVRAPDVDGLYDIEIDVVQEDVAWFRERGSKPAVVRCRVTGGRPAETDSGRPTFGTRHPRLRRAVVALGFDALRRVYRRARQRRRQAQGPPAMSMYCIPRAEVVALATECGGQVLAVDSKPLTDGFQNGLYWVRVP